MWRRRVPWTGMAPRVKDRAGSLLRQRPECAWIRMAKSRECATWRAGPTRIDDVNKVSDRKNEKIRLVANSLAGKSKKFRLAT